MIARRLAVCCALLAAGCALAAQVQSQLSPQVARIGDDLEYTVKVSGASPGSFSFPIPAVAGFELLGVDSSRLRDENTLVFTLAVFDTGAHTLPPLPVIVGSGSSAETLMTSAVSVRINSVLSGADTTLRDAKPYLEHPFMWRELLGYWWIPAMIIVSLLAVWIYRRFFARTTGADVEISVPLLPPYDEAVRGLLQIKDQKYPSRGMLKEFYSEFSHVMKRYFERRYDVPALEMTTYELEYYFTECEYPPELKQKLIPAFREGDLVKFAKYVSDPRHAEECLDLGFAILTLTRPVETPVENAKEAVAA